jgi:hypothetical protein
MNKILLLFMFIAIQSVSLETLACNQTNNNDNMAQTQSISSIQQEPTQQPSKLQNFNTRVNETVNTVTNVMNGIRTIKSYLE